MRDSTTASVLAILESAPGTANIRVSTADVNGFANNVSSDKGIKAGRNHKATVSTAAADRRKR
jgi:hypothetical protein